jgi:hypothetical protein
MSPEKGSSTRGERRRAKRKAEKPQGFHLELPSIPFPSNPIARGIVAAALLTLSYGGYRFLTNEDRPSETASIVDQLKYSDSVIKQHPDRAVDEAKRIFTLAARDVCTEVLCDPRKFDGTNIYLSDFDFQNRSRINSGCKNPQIPTDVQATAGAFDNQIIFNISGLTLNLVSKQPWTNPAETIYLESGHEILHANTPLKEPNFPQFITDSKTGQQVKVDLNKGLGSWVETPSDALPGRKCYTLYRQQIEELIVQDAIERITRRAGITNLPPVYPRLTLLYRSRVLEPYFGGDNRPLLLLQQQSDQVHFFSLIGEKLGAEPDLFDQAAKGEGYLASIFAGLPLN